MKNAVRTREQSESLPYWVGIAGEEHLEYVDEIRALIALSAQERGTGRGQRSVEEITQKILDGQAVIAVSHEGVFVGFCYVNAYENEQYFANSALIVAHQFRGQGASRQIKERAFALGRQLYPNAVPITITTSAAVLKLNHELGYRPVAFSEITKDPKYWEGCKSCVNYDVLTRTEGKNCLCTAMRCDEPLLQIKPKAKPSKGLRIVKSGRSSQKKNNS